MINIELVPISTVIENWKQIAVSELNFNEDLLTEWILDAYNDIGTYKQYKERVQKLKIRNYKAQLPCGFRQSLYVLAQPIRPQEEAFFLTEYIRQEPGNENCTWEYKRVCKCPEDKHCNCEQNYIETAGYLFINNLEQAKGFKFATVQDFTQWYTTDPRRWIVLQPQKNEVSLLNYRELGIHLHPSHFFTIDNGYIITDFKEADLLIGYLGIPIGEDGLPLVPNMGSYTNALIAALERKFAYIQYRKSRSGADLNFFQLADREYSKWKVKAREDMNAQTFEEMWAMGEATNQFLVPNQYHGLDQRKSQKINNGFTRY